MVASRARSRFVFAALLLTLVLAGLLGFDAVVTGRYHRSVAEGVLRDYAAFAAGELTSRAQGGWAQRIYPLLSTVAVRGPTAPLPPMSTLLVQSDTATQRIVESAGTLVRIRPANSLESSGTALDPRLSAAIGESLPNHVRAFLSPRSYLAVLWLSKGGSESVTFAIGTLSPFGAPPLVYGLVLPVGAAGELIRPVAARAPLLPQTLTHGVNLERMVGYRMTTPGGAVVVAAGEAAGSPFAATRVLDSAWGGLRIEVALDQALAGRLVIGGLPRSRLPLVAVLFGLTAVLVATAWVQLRRERELVRQREDFVASVSHELRTPLAQIRLFAETLRLDRVRSADERGRSLEIIDQEARRLSHLVENLLAVSRADRGSLEITRRRLDLMTELRRAVESFEPIAAARTVRLAVEGPDHLDAVADGEAFRQIVLNLLDNAVKFGPPGQVVGLSMAEVNGEARLTIDDEGPGIPADARERVFERFVRLDREFESGIAGTGLGLALVRELAKLHGGSVVASNAPNGGTRITVELPRDGGGG